MPAENINTSSVVVDEEYKSAIQPVVDNTMRTDILGPHFCRVLKDHNPTRENITMLITKEVGANPELKKALREIIAEHNKDTKMKWVDRAMGAIGTIFLALVIWGVQYLITHN